MKKGYSSLLFLIPVLFAACADPENPADNDNDKDKDKDTVTVPFVEAPSIKSPFEAGGGGVQITRIYFHQDSNMIRHGLRAEWVVLESYRDMPTKGWWLDASDGQRFPLPDTLYRKLYIYSPNGPGYDNDTVKIWKRSANAWVWNNTEPDTGKIINADGEVVDFITYDAKK